MVESIRDLLRKPSHLGSTFFLFGIPIISSIGRWGSLSWVLSGFSGIRSGSKCRSTCVGTLPYWFGVSCTAITEGFWLVRDWLYPLVLGGKGLPKAIRRGALLGRARAQNGTGGRVSSSRLVLFVLFVLVRIAWLGFVARNLGSSIDRRRMGPGRYGTVSASCLVNAV